MDLLLPAITGITPVSETLRDTCTCALNPRNGGLGIVNPATVADSEYRFSTIINKELVSAILENRGEEFIPGSQSTLKAKREYKAAKIKMEEPLPKRITDFTCLAHAGVGWPSGISSRFPR